MLTRFYHQWEYNFLYMQLRLLEYDRCSMIYCSFIDSFMNKTFASKCSYCSYVNYYVVWAVKAGSMHLSYAMVGPSNLVHELSSFLLWKKNTHTPLFPKFISLMARKLVW